MTFQNVVSMCSNGNMDAEIPGEIANGIMNAVGYSGNSGCQDNDQNYGCWDNQKTGKEFLGKSVYEYEYYRVGKRKFIEPEMKRCNCRCGR